MNSKAKQFELILNQLDNLLKEDSDSKGISSVSDSFADKIRGGLRQTNTSCTNTSCGSGGDANNACTNSSCTSGSGMTNKGCSNTTCS